MNLNLYSKKLSKYKKTVLAKAALITALTFPFVGCGAPQAKPKYESKTDSAKMEVVQDTTELVDEELTETSTVDTIEGKVSTTENGKTTEQQTAYVVDPETKTTESIGEITTEKTTEKGGKTTTTVVTTTSKTNDKTTNKTTTGKTTTGKTTTSKTTTNKTTQPTTTTVVTTTRVTTAKPTTTTTTTTTTAPVQTEPIVTANPYENRTYTKYDLMSSDPMEAAYAFDQLSYDMYRELYKGYSVQRGYGLSNGYGECRAVLAVLNYNQGINLEGLASDKALGSYSEQDFLNMAGTLDFSTMEELTGSRVDFTKYVIDEEFANFINQTNNAFLNYQNGNEDEYLSIVNNYYDNLDYVDDYVKKLFIDFSLAGCYDARNEDFMGLNETAELFEQNVAYPLYNSYSPYIGKSFTR